MGTKGKGLVGVNVEELVAQLNKALADEWLAYYQYWIGARLVTGPMRHAAASELVEHAADELEHADRLAARILELDGTPILDPHEWGKLANCSYLKPTDPYVKAIIQQGVVGERCAIDVYSRLLALTKDKDPITFDLVLSILKDEVRHEEDFESILQDLDQMEKRRP